MEFIEARNKEMDDKRQALGVTDHVLEVEGVTPAMAVALGEHEVKTLEDLARLRHRRLDRLLRGQQGEGARAHSGRPGWLQPHFATTPTPSS